MFDPALNSVPIWAAVTLVSSRNGVPHCMTTELNAPVVVAKGARLIAERIRNLATEHEVPIVQKPELARAMYKSVEIGHAVPEHLFRAVAEVLAYVYRIDRRAEKIRERQQPLNAAPQTV